MNKIFTAFFISTFFILLSACQTNYQKEGKVEWIEIERNDNTKNNKFGISSKIELIQINGQRVKDLVLLAKVWGFLKYYHPNIAKGDYNWDYELFIILPLINKARNKNERDEILSDWIKKLGTFEAGKNSKNKEENIKIKPDLDWIASSDLSLELVQRLTKVKNAERTGSHYYIKLAKGVGNPQFKNEEAYPEMKYPDTGNRLLSLFRYWNIIQYYFPYKNLIEDDWEKVLEEFIPKFIDAKNELGYKLAVLEIIGRVRDTHANILGVDSCLSNYNGLNYAPLEITFIENKAVVTNYNDNELGKKSGLLKGDVISKINNQAVEQIVNDKLKYAPASNYPTQLRNIAQNLLRTNDSILNVQVVRNKKIETNELITYSADKINIYKRYQRKDTCFKFINKNIGYLYLGAIKNSYLPQIMNEIKNTKGLIIDLRCYPSEFVVFTLGEYLVPQGKPFAKVTNGSILSPGLFSYTDNLTIGNDRSKVKYKGKIVIMVNEMTQSQAEYTAMAFRVAPQATVIGSTTAGADGNVSEIYLPGGIRTMISGIGVYYPDGRETQRVGIIPDIEVKPTIEGIKQGKDEMLEKAIEIINNN